MFNKVNVLGCDFKVTREIPKEVINAMAREGEIANFVALFMGVEKKIYVSNTITNEEYLRALMHEMGHATMYRNGLHFSGALSLELEEIIVETFATTFYEFITGAIKKWLKYDDATLRNNLRAFVK